MLKERIIEEFKNRFMVTPNFLIRSPGRVNLIGEHTDYNDGFVMPMAIDREIWMAIRPRSDRVVSLYSLDFKETRQFSLDLIKKEGSSWLEYIKGVSGSLKKQGLDLSGWEGVMMSNIPIGAGLSSSAALEMATIQSFKAVSGFTMDHQTMAEVGQDAENRWIGVKCGIMDPLISASGKKDHAQLIDCRTLDCKAIPIPTSSRIIILDTTTRRGLMDSAYNERRAQCESAAEVFQVKALRDITMELLSSHSLQIDSLVKKRVQHVVAENYRTQAAAKAMIQSDVTHLGKLMNESHQSLRDLFEVSSNELNTIVECATHNPYCYGARMTGAGFGGCAVAMVQKEKSETFIQEVKSCFKTKTGLNTQIYECEAVDGAEWALLGQI